MPATKFIHLHTHSHYSLLDGLSKVDDMVNIAVADGMPAMAITDHGNMYGAIDFYKTCKKKGIKPIIGCEVYMTAGSRTDRTAEANGKRNFHLILLAKNLQGYKNLIRLVTLANLEGYYYKPRVDKEIPGQYASPTYIDASAYESIHVLADALRAGKITPATDPKQARESVRTYLAALKGYKGLGNTLNMNAEGDTLKTTMVYRTRAGKWARQ